MHASRLGALAAVICAAALALPARAATISTNSTAPTSNVIASQLADLGPGPQANDRDYTDNGGPPGQTFTVPSATQLGAVTVLGRGDAGSFNPGTFSIQIGSVNTATGQITELLRETAPASGVTANNQYLTFSLDSPVSLVPGTTYAFSILSSAGWYGLAHGTGDDYAGGQAFNTSLTTTSAGNADPRRVFHGFVSPHPGGYDYVFALQRVVPEPTGLAVLCVGGLGLLARRRRA